MSTNNPARTYVLLGISGSGKGVQAKRLLRAIPGSVNISTGDGLRRVARKQNLLGRYIKRILRRGDLAPYWSAAYLWLSDFFERLRGDEPLVFDGAPRRIAEARMMDDFMRDIGRELPIVLYLRISPRVALKRLLARRRSDDILRAIRERFRFFEHSVRPVIRYYRTRRRLITINGDQPIPAVWRDIRRTLKLR